MPYCSSKFKKQSAKLIKITHTNNTTTIRVYSPSTMKLIGETTIPRMKKSDGKGRRTVSRKMRRKMRRKNTKTKKGGKKTKKKTGMRRRVTYKKRNDARGPTRLGRWKKTKVPKKPLPGSMHEYMLPMDATHPSNVPGPTWIPSNFPSTAVLPYAKEVDKAKIVAPEDTGEDQPWSFPLLFRRLQKTVKRLRNRNQIVPFGAEPVAVPLRLVNRPRGENSARKSACKSTRKKKYHNKKRKRNRV